MKKAQSISINTIVVAAIALVVLLLIVVIFTTNITGWRRSTGQCESQGGNCIDKTDISEKCGGDYQKIRSDLVCYKGTEADITKACCVSV